MYVPLNVTTLKEHIQQYLSDYMYVNLKATQCNYVALSSGHDEAGIQFFKTSHLTYQGEPFDLNIQPKKIVTKCNNEPHSQCHNYIRNG